MGVLKSLLNACKCSSECSLNAEVEELQRFLKKLALEDLQELVAYYHTRTEAATRTPAPPGKLRLAA